MSAAPEGPGGSLRFSAQSATEMALVNVTNVVVLDNPTTFTNPLTFEVTFECLQELDAGKLSILLLVVLFLVSLGLEYCTHSFCLLAKSN